MAGTGVGEAQFGIPVDITGGTIIVVPTVNRAALTFRTVPIAAAGTPQQGPDVSIPNGFAVVVVFRVTQAGAPNGFVANSLANTAVAASRTEMLKGDTRRFFVTNMNLLFFDSDTTDAVFELFVEQ